MEIITRKDALAQGLRRYHTGKACGRGHIAERLVSDCSCLECDAMKQRSRRARDPERVQEIQKRSDAKRRDKKLAEKRAWIARNRDRVLQQKREWRARNVEKVREQMRLWREANIQAVNCQKRESYWRLRDGIRERERARYAASPEKQEAAVAVAARRRAREKAAPGSHTASDIREILTAQNYRCAYCRVCLNKAKRHVDHIVPLARGGSNDRANLQATCVSCNRSKGAKDPIVFAQERGLLL